MLKSYGKVLWDPMVASRVGRPSQHFQARHDTLFSFFHPSSIALLSYNLNHSLRTFSVTISKWHLRCISSRTPTTRIFSTTTIGSCGASSYYGSYISSRTPWYTVLQVIQHSAESASQHSAHFQRLHIYVGGSLSSRKNSCTPCYSELYSWT